MWLCIASPSRSHSMVGHARESPKDLKSLCSPLTARRGLATTATVSARVRIRGGDPPDHDLTGLPSSPVLRPTNPSTKPRFGRQGWRELGSYGDGEGAGTPWCLRRQHCCDSSWILSLAVRSQKSGPRRDASSPSPPSASSRPLPSLTNQRPWVRSRLRPHCSAWGR